MSALFSFLFSFLFILFLHHLDLSFPVFAFPLLMTPALPSLIPLIFTFHTSEISSLHSLFLPFLIHLFLPCLAFFFYPPLPSLMNPLHPFFLHFFLSVSTFFFFIPLTPASSFTSIDSLFPFHPATEKETSGKKDKKWDLFLFSYPQQWS